MLYNSSQSHKMTFLFKLQLHFVQFEIKIAFETKQKEKKSFDKRRNKVLINNNECFLAHFILGICHLHTRK